MKKLLFIATLICGVFVYGQNNVIKVNPLAYFGGTDLVSYEFAVANQSSVQLSAGISSFKLSSYKYNSFGGGVQYRYYFEEALKGWYGAGAAGYSGGKTKLEGGGLFEANTDSEAKFGSFQVGARAGYQWVFSSNIVIDLNIGIGYSNFSYTWDNEADENIYGDALKASGILPQGSFGIGYRF